MKNFRTSLLMLIALTTFVFNGFTQDTTVTVTSTGEVGIGTTTPQALLEVNGSSLIRSNGFSGNASGVAGGLEIRGASGTYEPGIALDNGSQQWNIVAWGDNSLQFTKISGATFSPFRIHSNSFHNALVIGQLGVGINNPTPTEELDVDGNIAVSGTVDGVDISELAARGANYTQLGGLNNSSVNITSTMTVLGTGTKTFTKIHPDSKIEVYVYSRMGAGSFNSTNGVRFQAWVDGNAPMISSEGAITSTNSIDFLSFFSVYEGLATGSHTVTIRARAASNGGTSTGVLSDPGGYGGRIIVKETW